MRGLLAEKGEPDKSFERITKLEGELADLRRGLAKAEEDIKTLGMTVKDHLYDGGKR